MKIGDKPLSDSLKIPLCCIMASKFSGNVRMRSPLLADSPILVFIVFMISPILDEVLFQVLLNAGPTCARICLQVCRYMNRRIRSQAYTRLCLGEPLESDFHRQLQRHAVCEPLPLQ